VHNPHKNVLLFIKYYDARAKQLRYVTQMVLHRTHMLDDVTDEVCAPVPSTAFAFMSRTAAYRLECASLITI